MGERGPKLNAPELKMTEERKKLFLDELASSGVWAAACRAASPGNTVNGPTPPCSSSFRNLKKRDIHFATQCEEAMEQARADIMAEIQRRGQDGFLEPKFYKGKRVKNDDGSDSVVRRFSDTLLLARARAMMPEIFSEKHDHRHTVQHIGGAHTFTSEDIHYLNEAQQQALTNILLTVQRGRGEDDTLAIEHQETVEAEFEEVREDYKEALPW